jgi:REP element-mobilizing transposase RayT
MGRRLRTDTAGTWHHVVNRGVSRQTIFFDDRDRLEFERLLGLAHERFGIVVHSYCWMTNHYHLLVECPNGGLSDSMHLVGSLYVRHVNDRIGRDGPLFRSRFFAKSVISDDYVLRLVRYIHRNPVAIVGQEHLVDYRWSSLRAHLGFRRAPAWLCSDVVIELCGGSDALRRFVVEPEGGFGPLRPDELLAAIDLMIDENELASHRSQADRTVAALLLDRLDLVACSELSRLLAFPTKQAEHAARSRARRRAERHPELAEVVDAVIDLAGDLAA